MGRRQRAWEVVSGIGFQPVNDLWGVKRQDAYRTSRVDEALVDINNHSRRSGIQDDRIS